MENNNIGATIREVRTQMQLSLDKAAAMTGISKAMLGQIERGESTPTVTVLWKISSGLRISLSHLLAGPSHEYSVTNIDQVEPVYEDNGRMIVRNIFPFSPVTGIDYLYIVLKPGCDYSSPSHLNVFEEYVFVTKGSLKMTIDGVEYNLSQYDSIKFRGNAVHSYANPKEEDTEFQNVLKYL